MKTLRALIEEYDTTDSIKKQKALQKLIVNICQKYITSLDKIASKYDIQAIDDPDYQSDRGYWNFEDDSYVILNPAGNHTVRLIYRDSWRYGGFCIIGHTFYADEVDNFDAEKFESKCQNSKLKKLKQKVVEQQKKLKEVQDLLEKFKEKVDIGKV